MSVVEYNFRLLIIDNQRVVVIPVKGEVRELPKREAEYALRFLGLGVEQPSLFTPKRITELAKPLNDASPVLNAKQISVLRLLGKSRDELTVHAISAETGFNANATYYQLSKLKKLQLAESGEPFGPNGELLYQITTTGIDVLADLTKAADNKDESQ